MNDYRSARGDTPLEALAKSVARTLIQPGAYVYYADLYAEFVESGKFTNDEFLLAINSILRPLGPVCADDRFVLWAGTPEDGKALVIRDRRDKSSRQ